LTASPPGCWLSPADRRGYRREPLTIAVDANILTSHAHACAASKVARSPAITVASIWLPGSLTLGLDAKDLDLMALTVVVSVLTVALGRANLRQGTVHLVIFGAFLFLAVTP
jgi:Ca2+/H+ antiporter